MLIALQDNTRIDAWGASRGLLYRCPNCHDEVILKQGRIVVPHFAHKPPTNCVWATGETREHMLSKKVIRDAFVSRGYKAECEVEVLSSAGDRRADVLIENKNGHRVAIEVQHTPISYEHIEERTNGYLAAGIPVVWIGLLSAQMKALADHLEDEILFEKYVQRPWEKWAHAYYFKELWYIDPYKETLWKGEFSDYTIDVPSTSWYNEYGEEQYAGGFSRKSNKWKTLILSSEQSLASINIIVKNRKGWSSNVFSLPGGMYARFK